MKYILALDQGTTNSRAILFNKAGTIISSSQQEFPQIFPKPGWVEHNPWHIWSSQADVAAQAILKAGITAKEVAAIGITNQRETAVAWSRRTGKPICNAIVWQDRRTALACDRLKKDGLAPLIRRKTGLVIDAYFSGTKWQWILTNVPGAKQKAKNGELAFGTVDSWLIWNLTGGKRHITDVTNASRTLLFDIRKGDWDDELLELFGIPRYALPQVRASAEYYGDSDYFGSSIPLAGMAGDQQAALFGQACTKPGMIKQTYGTGCFMLMPIGNKPVLSKNQLLTTVAWKIGKQMEYALEGSIFIGGGVVQWLRDGLGIIRSSDEIEALAAKVKDNAGVYLVPAFAGLGAPHWDQYARGIIAGITRGVNASHIARAALESIAYQTAEVVKAIETDTGTRLKELRVDGGASVNNLLMQFQADILGTRVVRPRVEETTALGAAYLAGLTVGYWKDQREIAKQWKVDQRFNPHMSPGKRKKLLVNWEKALKRAKAWEDHSA
jgi:glycerol kinase